MSEPFIGEIKIVGFNFAPRGYAFCDGSILAISSNTALFALLGTTFGGDGRTTFALPDLRGRVPMGMGQGPGLSDRLYGQDGGEENHTLTVNEMPSHSHTVTVNMACSAEDAETGNPVGKFPAVPAAGGTAVNAYASAATGTMGASTGTANQTGGGQAHNNMQPYLTLNFVIAVEGLFPSRN